MSREFKCKIRETQKKEKEEEIRSKYKEPMRVQPRTISIELKFLWQSPGRKRGCNMVPILEFLWRLENRTTILSTWAYVSGPLLQPSKILTSTAWCHSYYTWLHVPSLSLSQGWHPPCAPRTAEMPEFLSLLLWLTFHCHHPWVKIGYLPQAIPCHPHLPFQGLSPSLHGDRSDHNLPPWLWQPYSLRLLVWSSRDSREQVVSLEHCLLSYSYRFSPTVISRCGFCRVQGSNWT